MDAWLLWLIAAVILGVGEIATGAFLLAPFAGGALLATLVAGIGGGPFAAWAVFLVSSVGLLTLLRPIATAHRRMPPQIRTGTAALIGRSGVVTEQVANHAGTGCVKLDGETWTARAYDEDDVIEPGAKVHVVEIKGAIALVSE
jgi:membrane protein implicated in regulation of membrane protease activity